MAGKFSFKKFSEIDLSDPFFDGLKNDYLGSEHSTDFIPWFEKKAKAGSTALVFSDDAGVGAFIYLKEENEAIELLNGTVLPAIPRVKIGTLRIAERFQRQRLGEGAVGLALWYWQKTKREEVYVTVFDKHNTLIGLFERFGFCLAGRNLNKECVYVKNRNDIDYSNPYKSFPFINPSFRNSGYLVVNDVYHDTLFPYSELKNALQEQVGLAVANGFTKIYIGSPSSTPPYHAGDPLLIYRRYTGSAGQPGYKSCITSYCVATDIVVAKENGIPKMSFEDLTHKITNKSVFDDQEIRTKYENGRNLTVIEMLYYGFFGGGNNVNWVWLKDHGLMGDSYPASINLSPDQFMKILREGNVDVSNVIIN